MSTQPGSEWFGEKHLKYVKRKQKILLDKWENESEWAKARGVMMFFCLTCGGSLTTVPPINGGNRALPRCPKCSSEMNLTDTDVLYGCVNPIDILSSKRKEA